MSITSKIVQVILEHVNSYASYSSSAEGQQNVVNGLRSINAARLREQLLLEQYETHALASRQAALTLYETFKTDFDSDELQEVEELIEKL